MLYNAAISACEKGEQWQQALDLFVAEQSVELLPDVITCNTSIACEKREQWQQALGLLGSPDVFPNSVTYSAAISACENLLFSAPNRWQENDEVVKQCLQDKHYAATGEMFCHRKL